MRNLSEHIVRLPRNLIVILITAYQHTLSPDHGPLRHLYTYGYCRHHPTCSEYGKRMVSERGAIIGSWLLFKRLLTCHPWAKISDEKLMEMAKRV